MLTLICCQLYAAAGDVARVKLNHSRIHSVLTGARAQFEPSGNLFKGLLKIVKDFRLAAVCYPFNLFMFMIILWSP